MFFFILAEGSFPAGKGHDAARRGKFKPNSWPGGLGFD
jgi:hypothetical protein